MKYSGIAILALGLVAAGGPQDDEAKARRAKVNDCQKRLEGADEAAKTAALEELAGINDDQARYLIGSKLTTDTDNVRRAAIKAIARQKRSSSAASLGRAVQGNIANEGLVRACIDALAELDMCSGIQVLVMIIQLKNKLGSEALAAIEKIGCPDAIPPLLGILQRAEAEEKKPDRFEGADLGGGGLGGMGGTGVGDEENKNKNKDLAGLASKIRDTLSKLAGRGFPSHREWMNALSSGQVRVKKASVFLCTKSGQTYEVPSDKTGKCPNPDPKSMHEEIFLKHKKE
jgi:hypothetical protein